MYHHHTIAMQHTPRKRRNCVLYIHITTTSHQATSLLLTIHMASARDSNHSRALTRTGATFLGPISVILLLELLETFTRSIRLERKQLR